MELAINIVLFLHLVGMASLVGASLAQVRLPIKQVTHLMRDGALTQLITGIALVGLVQAHHESIRMPIIAVKFSLLVIILVLLFVGRKSLSNQAYFAIVGLSLADVALALFVSSS